MRNGETNAASVWKRSRQRLSAIGVLLLSAIVLSACNGADKHRSVGTEEEQRVSAGERSIGRSLLHPMFDMTSEELLGVLEGLPPSTIEAVGARPQLFLEYVGRMLELDPAFLVLVDKSHLLGADYQPDGLLDLGEYADRLVLNRGDLSLRAVIMPDLLAMAEAARQSGITLDISSSYRSYAYQNDLFAYWVEQLGLEEAERVSARAGSSQHQLGTTIDFGSVSPEYADAPGGVWLAENAWRYGFSLSYSEGREEITGYSYEPWHYRYISRVAARMEREFFGGVQQTMLEFWNDNAEWFRERDRTSDG